VVDRNEGGMSRLAGKTALVTGGGSGIGLATAKLLLGEGARVAIAGRDAAKLRRAAEGLNAGDRLFHHAADVSDPGQAEGLAAAVTAKFGRIDLLVNNAGTNIQERQFRQLTPQTWKLLVGANLDGAFYCARAVLPQMRQRKDGLIINVNSIAGLRANPLGGAAYAAAKFGLRGLMTALAAEEKDGGVRVSGIYPGEVNTPILDARPNPVDAAHRQAILQPEDVAAAVLFIATLPRRVCIPELVITPAGYAFV
jgi:NAD(P)-dependent dehydrogenase (short-subunit alcohol dehydrogenase family)